MLPSARTRENGSVLEPQATIRPSLPGRVRRDPVMYIVTKCEDAFIVERHKVTYEVNIYAKAREDDLSRLGPPTVPRGVQAVDW